MQRLSFVVVSVMLVIVFALQTIPSQAYPVTDWTRLYEGVQYATGYEPSNPRMMRAFALKISLANPAITMYTSHGNGTAPYEVALQTTPAFLADHGCVAAVNSCFFNASLSPNTNIEGLLVSNGSVVSTWEANRDAEIRFTSDKIASIVNNGGTSGVYTGCSGDAWHLIYGDPEGDDSTPNPRTSAGITQDGKFLILVCVDGRQPGWSDGATIYDMSLWQQSFGAYNAMNFDGGGSTTMSISGYGSYVNSPCYGYARSVGASLGVLSSGFSDDGPDADCRDSTHYNIVKRGNMNNVYDYHYIGTGWSTTNIGGTATSSPSICSMTSTRLDAFVRASDYTIRHSYSTDGGVTWVGAFSDNLGGYLYSGPDSCSWGSNRMDIVALGYGGAVCHKYYNGSWSSWFTLSGVVGNSSPSICSWGTNRLDAFVRGPSNSIYHNYSTNGGSSWTGFTENLGGYLYSAPDACSWGANRIDLVALGYGGAIVYKYYNGSWSSWYTLGGNFVGEPTICTPGVNQLDIFARGPDDCLYRAYSTNGGASWSSWVSYGSYF